MVKYVYWVDELSLEAITILECIVIKQLKIEGYDDESILYFVKDLKNEKLGSLDYFLTSTEMVKLSNL